MAKARRVRSRTLSLAFGAYVLVVLGVTFFVSAPLSVYVDPGATRWISAAYVLLGALVLVSVCVGAVARSARLDARLAELEGALREAPAAAPAGVPASPLEEGALPAEPSDRDVDQLLEELHRIGETAAEAGPGEEPEAPSRRVVEATAELRVARSREFRRLTKIRDAVAATAAGPAIASAGLLGVFATLLPASDGMLLGNLQLNAFLGLAGLGWLVGLPIYAGVSFHRLS